MLNIAILYILPTLLVIAGIIEYKVKMNEFVGLRTPETLSDPEVWDKANKKAGQLKCVAGVTLYVLNPVLIFYLDVTKTSTFLLLIYVQLAVMIITTIFSIKYTTKLKGGERMQSNNYSISKAFVSTTGSIAIFTFIVGILMLFVPSNEWKKVNSISGIGFIAIGTVFTYLFFTNASKSDEERTKNFGKHFLWFTIFIILWSLASVAIAYLPV